LGCGYIVASKILGANAVLVTGVPVALMLAYAGMMTFFRGIRLRDDQAGDNLYYIGFIFTLTSLAISLYQYSNDASVEQIIQNFGIAVASTIAGITLRILFNQMRRDPMEVEVAARLELSDAAKRVRRELDGVTQELTHFRRTNLQMIEEAQNEMLKLVKAGDSGIKGAAAVAGSDLLAAANALSEPMRRAATEVSSLAASLDNSVQNLSKATAALVERMDRSKTPDQVIEVSIHKSIDDLRAVVTQATGLIEAQAREIRRSGEWLERLRHEAAASAAARRSILSRVFGRPRSSVLGSRGAEPGPTNGGPPSGGPER
jgi:hypothetical protein